MAKEEAGVAGSDLGSTLFGAIAGAVAGEVSRAVAPQAANDMRRAIKDGNMQRGIGPFVVNEGFSAFGSFQFFSQSATITLRGTCKTTEAELKVVLEQRDAGHLFGLTKKYLLVGIDKDSAKILAHTCKER
jgi:hypothetical protein